MRCARPCPTKLTNRVCIERGGRAVSQGKGSCVSPERLQRYETIAAGDAVRALRLYMWNTALSESLYGPIQGLEVTLRNKIHQRLRDQFGTRWYDESRVGLQYAQRDQVLRAKQSLQQQGKPQSTLRG
jgi:hypothetical protein